MASMRIVVADCGAGNLHSVVKALELAGSGAVEVSRQRDPQACEEAGLLVLPGQGAAAAYMNSLKDSGLDRVVADRFGERPFLGICMGLQALFDHSEEHGGVDGLGLIAGVVAPLPGRGLKLPQLGWNQVRQTHPHQLWQGIEPDASFYFANSFMAVPTDKGAVIGTTTYGVEFCSALVGPKALACQFHPEKSGEAGLRLLANFIDWVAE